MASGSAQPHRLTSTIASPYSPPPQRSQPQSVSSSSLADDERSSSESDQLYLMGPAAMDHRDEPRAYVGEDTRLTSTKELSGWYAYGFAAEVFVICGMGSFIPITLEQLARENGVLLSDRITPCPSSSTHPVQATAVKDLGQCVVYVLGMEINTASFAMYTFSLSVLFQALLVVSISCAADHGNYRKRLLLFFAFGGAIACMLFLTVIPPLYLLGAVLAMVSNTCFGASFVLLNSFLPLLVRHHPTVQYGSIEDSPSTTPPHESDGDESDASTALLAPPLSALPDLKDTTSVELQLSTQISSKGIGIGYLAGLFVQLSSIVLIWTMQSTTFSLRLVLFVIGAWWFIFTIPTAMWLRPRPGPPLAHSGPKELDSKRSWLAYFTQAWVSLWRTVKLARRLKDITLFLGAWFLLSDAIATVSGTAILYAKTSLFMKPEALGLISVIGTVTGVVGAFSWAAISKYCGLKPHQTILACICIFELIPLYGLLGYLPFIQRLGFLGLQQPWEMYLLGSIYGFVLGGLSSYCRSLFGSLIPPGSEAAFYALYAITDKGSSVFGPAIVGAIVDKTGEIRPAFWFLAVLVGLPGFLVMWVDVDRGRAEARGLAEVLRGHTLEESSAERAAE